MEVTSSLLNPMRQTKLSQAKTTGSKRSISKKSKLSSLNSLSIKIEKLLSGKQKGYYAKIKELNSEVMADSIEEIFALIPVLIEVESQKTDKI